MAACLKFCQGSRRESHQEFRFPSPILARFPARSRRDFCHRKFAPRRESWRDSCSILARFWPPGLLLPGENLGEIRGRIAPRFWPPGLLLPGENLGEIRGRIAPRFWPPEFLLPIENLGEMRGGIPPRSRFLFYKGQPTLNDVRNIPNHLSLFK